MGGGGSTEDISAVVHCDATQENVGLDPGVIPDGGFDVVTVCGSLTAADVEHFT